MEPVNNNSNNNLSNDLNSQSSLTFAKKYKCTPTRIIGWILIGLLWLGSVASLLAIIHYDLINYWNIWLMFAILCLITVFCTIYIIIKTCEKKQRVLTYQKVEDLFISSSGE